MATSSTRSTAFPASLGLFGAGLLATVVIFGLYAAGHENLPVWLNLATLLAPLGFIIGVVSLVLTAHKR